MKCQEKFHENSRIQIFNDFYSCADKSIQSQQLATLVSEHETARKRGADPSNSRRSMSREYHLVKKGEKIRVCQKMFLNTFAIDEKRIRRLLNNKSEAGTPIPDGRGRHSNHYHVEKRTGYVIEHIKSFKVVESHYVRCDAKFEYLPTDISVSEMYRMYLQWREKKNYPLESY